MRPNVPSSSFATFALYVAAIKKRLLNHFGIAQKTATRWVAQHKERVHQWHARGIPADKVARILYEAALLNPHASYVANPLPAWGQGVLTLASMVALSTGVYFFWQALQAEVPAIRPTVRPDPIPSFTPPNQQIIDTVGPIGLVQPVTQTV